MGTQKVTENDFNVLHFEKQLTTLKDSQEAINNCCQWCLQNRSHHKKIVSSWLNVLKRVKVEQRLILFYLANDVVQYSKRRNYEYVESWGTALQKATTMVRDEKVKHKILRIFKIWEQRNVYNEEFISDLCGLLSVQPSGTKTDEPHEFQPSYVINKIKSCVKLETDTDIKLKHLKEHNPKIQIDDGLIGSLKDRAHMDDVEKEVEVYVKHVEDYINALKLEIKNRITLISVLKQAETQLEADRKDVKVVANAYKMFGTRVKTFQRKLEEHKSTLNSPVPSPDVNAPSPSSDSDIELPGEVPPPSISPKEVATTTSYNPKAELQQQQQQYNAGYYNSLPSEENMSNSFLSNGFPSFIGSDLSFNLDNLNGSIFNSSVEASNTTNETPTTNYSSSIQMENPPLPVQAPTMVSPVGTNYSYTSVTHQLPLMPPPMPLFSKPEADYSNNFGQNCGANTDPSRFDNDFFNTTAPTSFPITSTSASSGSAPFLEDSYEPPDGANPYPPSSVKTTGGSGNEEYNPEDDVLSWEVDTSDWDGGGAGLPRGDTDTPESPPTFEKEGYGDPVEYHEGEGILNGAPSASDVDHRVVPATIVIDLEDSLSSLGGKDVDHRNLISLTGSPGNSSSNNGTSESIWTSQNTDQDYRVMPPNMSGGADRDYRMGFNIEQLKLPPPPPPPSKFPSNYQGVLSDIPTTDIAPATGVLSQSTNQSKSPRKSDNIDSIDMDLSDEDVLQIKPNDNLKVIVDPAKDEQHSQFSLEPPPPLPDLPDDVDANNFLDDLSCDLHEFSNLSDELNSTNHVTDEAMMVDDDNRDLGMHHAPTPPHLSANAWNPPHPMPFANLIEPPPILPSMNTPPPNNVPPSMMNAPPPPPPPGPMMPPPHPTAWLNKGEDESPWFQDDHEQDDFQGWKPQEPMMYQQGWMGPPPPNNAGFPFRGRGINRGSPMRRGRGRNNFHRGGNNFRLANMSPRGGLPKGARGQWSPRATFRGNFRGGF